MGVATATKKAAASSGHRALVHLFGEFRQVLREHVATVERITRFEETIRHMIDGLPAEDGVEFTRR